MRIPRLRRPRGSTLVVAITLIAVLTVVAAGMIRRGTAEMENASAKRHYDVAVACADGARDLLLSQFRAYNVAVDITQSTVNEVAGSRRYATGHYDSFAIKTVTPIPQGSIGQMGERDIDRSNRLVKDGLGGKFYEAVVVCTDSSAPTRQSEVEYVVRFGL